MELTIQIPKHTSKSAAKFFNSNIFSLKKIDESRAPNTGIKKLKIVIEPTLLYFSNKAHRVKAAEDNNAI